MSNPQKTPDANTPADAEFIEFLADVVVRIMPQVSITEATNRLEQAGQGMTRHELYSEALGIVANVPEP